jgi:hypothetical protein
MLNIKFYANYKHICYAVKQLSRILTILKMIRRIKFDSSGWGSLLPYAHVNLVTHPELTQAEFYCGSFCKPTNAYISPPTQKCGLVLHAYPDHC